MSDVIQIIAAVLLVLFLIILLAWILASGMDQRFKERFGITAAIEACEKSLPRDQECEAVVTARVKEKSP